MYFSTASLRPACLSITGFHSFRTELCVYCPENIQGTLTQQKEAESELFLMFLTFLEQCCLECGVTFDMHQGTERGPEVV